LFLGAKGIDPTAESTQTGKVGLFLGRLIIGGLRVRSVRQNGVDAQKEIKRILPVSGREMSADEHGTNRLGNRMMRALRNTVL
jgi:hypothetical protein